MGAYLFFGWTIATLIIPPAADIIGRRMLIILCMIGNTACLVAMLLVTTVTQMSVVLLMLGLAQAGSVSVNFIFTTEFLPKAQKVLFASVCLFCDNISLALASIYYLCISHNYRWFNIFACFNSFLGLLGLIFIATESPLWLLQKGRIPEALSNLQRMFTFNGNSVTQASLKRHLGIYNEN